MVVFTTLQHTKNHGNCNDDSHKYKDDLFGCSCKKCGTMTVYADDAMYVTIFKTRAENQANLTRNFDNITEFLTSNLLTVNQQRHH